MVPINHLLEDWSGGIRHIEHMNAGIVGGQIKRIALLHGRLDSEVPIIRGGVAVAAQPAGMGRIADIDDLQTGSAKQVGRVAVDAHGERLGLRCIAGQQAGRCWIANIQNAQSIEGHDIQRIPRCRDRNNTPDRPIACLQLRSAGIADIDNPETCIQIAQIGGGSLHGNGRHIAVQGLGTKADPRALDRMGRITDIDDGQTGKVRHVGMGARNRHIPGLAGRIDAADLHGLPGIGDVEHPQPLIRGRDIGGGSGNGNGRAVGSGQGIAANEGERHGVADAAAQAVCGSDAQVERALRTIAGGTARNHPRPRIEAEPGRKWAAIPKTGAVGEGLAWGREGRRRDLKGEKLPNRQQPPAQRCAEQGTTGGGGAHGWLVGGEEGQTRAGSVAKRAPTACGMPGHDYNIG